jgi:thioredoxin-like negative regulator of GroEL
MRPKVEGLVADYGDQVRFFQVDIREEEDLVWAYQVLSTPTYIAFRDSEPVGSLAGEVDETELRNLLDDAIAGEGG